MPALCALRPRQDSSDDEGTVHPAKDIEKTLQCIADGEVKLDDLLQWEVKDMLDVVPDALNSEDKCDKLSEILAKRFDGIHKLRKPETAEANPDKAQDAYWGAVKDFFSVVL